MLRRYCAGAATTPVDPSDWAMTWFRRSVSFLMVPMNICCVIWVWFGQWFCEIDGWMLLFFTVFVGPIMVVALTVTSILAFRQSIPTELGLLDLSQSLTHLALWVAMVGYGFFLVDTNDNWNSDRSIFTLAAGGDSLATSFDLADVCLWVAIFLYGLLLLLLIRGQRNRARVLAGLYEAATTRDASRTLSADAHRPDRYRGRPSRIVATPSPDTLRPCQLCSD